MHLTYLLLSTSIPIDCLYELHIFFRYKSNIKQIICRFDKHIDARYVEQYFKLLVSNTKCDEWFFKFRQQFDFQFIQNRQNQRKNLIASDS